MLDYFKKPNQNLNSDFFASKTFIPKSQTKHKRMAGSSLCQITQNLTPSIEFSRSHYSKDILQRVLLRNTLTPSTPQITDRRSSIPDEKIEQTVKKITNVSRLPTDAFTKWKNEDKCHLLFIENVPLESEEKNNTFRRFDDAMNTQTSWMRNFDQEKTVKDLLFKQLEYNEKNKELLKSNLDDLRLGSVKGLLEKYDSFHKKINKMPPVKKKKKKPLTYLKLNEGYANYIGMESFEEEIIHYKFYWNVLNQNYWKPSAREGATLTSFEGKIYLYGGVSNELHSELCELDIENEWRWNKIKTLGDNPTGGRTGHSVFPWKNGLIVFGGEKKYNKEMKIRECYNDLRYLNLTTFEWKWIRPSGDLIEARRNNAYCSVGKWIFIHGGINNYGRYMNDLYGFNIEHMKWSLCEVENLTEIEGVAFHTMCGIFKGEPRLNSIYHPFEYCEKRKNNIKCVGLYLFGGKLKNNESLNTLTVIKFGTKPLKWVNLETEGEKPDCRYYHSMNQYYDLNILIIFGGKTDGLKNPKKLEYGDFFSDIWILNLGNLNWMKVKTNRISELDRCGHATTIFESKLLVFGGYNKNNYANANIYCMELNQKKANNLFKENKLKTITINNGENNNNDKKDNEQQNDAQINLDDLGLDGGLRNNGNNRVSKFTSKYGNLTFSNFRSFMPIPRKEELYKGQQHEEK